MQKYPYRSPPHSPQLCPSPRFSLPRLHRRPHSRYTRPPQPQASGGNPYAGGAPAAPPPRTNAANPYAGNAPGTSPQTGAGAPLYARNTPPDAPHAVTPPPPRGTGGNPYGNVAPVKPKRPRAPMSPEADDPDRHPGDIPAMIIVTMISGTIRTGKPNASDPNQGTWKSLRRGRRLRDAGRGCLRQRVPDGPEDKGKCVVTVDGTKSYGKWTLNGGVFQLDCGGLSCTGTLQDEIPTLNDVQGQGVTLYFVKSGSTMQQPLDGDKMTQDAAAGSDTDVGIYVLDPPPTASTPSPRRSLPSSYGGLLHGAACGRHRRNLHGGIPSPSNGRTATSTVRKRTPTPRP